VYDPAFELYVGDYAFAYSHEFPKALLALFTEQYRRPRAELEASELEILEPEKVDSGESQITKPDPQNSIGDEANRDIPTEAYPTIGPTGEAPANVNGCACSIELYCGPKALTKDDGKLCLAWIPVVLCGANIS
jgi:hypothetical protein